MSSTFQQLNTAEMHQCTCRKHALCVFCISSAEHILNVLVSPENMIRVYLCVCILSFEHVLNVFVPAGNMLHVYSKFRQLNTA